jgi:hypothetical protein
MKGTMSEGTMMDEIRDPELGDIRDAWRVPLPLPEMHERIIRTCNREFGPTGLRWRFAAVAALMVVLSLAVSRSGLRKQRGFGIAPTGTESQLELLPPLVPTARTAVAAAPGIPASRRRSAERKTVRSPEAMLVTPFYSLMDAPPRLGDGILVRVVVPASALQIAGVPIWEGQINDAVAADILIGEDGMARAIRFVGFE